MLTTQICNVCGIEKPLDEFPRNGTDLTGAPRRRPDCTVCYNIRRKLDKKKHAKFVNNTKHRTGEEAAYSLRDWQDALVHFAGLCPYCGTKPSRRVKLTKDHAVPVSKGGLTVRRNILPGCTKCNSSKSDQLIENWYPKQPFYSHARMERIKQWLNQ